MIPLTLVVIAKNELDMLNFNREFVLDADLIEYVNGGGRPSVPVRSLASIANGYLDICNTPVFGVCHADMEFGPGSLRVFYDCAMSPKPGVSLGPDGAVCGAVGRNMRFADTHVGPGDSSYVWSKDWGRPTPRQIAAGYPTEPMGPCNVSTLDSSCIFFPTNRGLRFDEQNFDGFHLHGEDLCLQAHLKGIPVLVPAANAWHACPEANGPGWQKEYFERFRPRLEAKWRGRFPDFVTT